LLSRFPIHSTLLVPPFSFRSVPLLATLLSNCSRFLQSSGSLCLLSNVLNLPVLDQRARILRIALPVDLLRDEPLHVILGHVEVDTFELFAEER
jgi:hypothetical protein